MVYSTQEIDRPDYKTPWRSYAGRHRNKVKQPHTGEMGAHQFIQKCSLINRFVWLLNSSYLFSQTLLANSIEYDQ